MTKRFPKYAKAADARCFKCGAELSRAVSSGFAPGRGAMVGECACGMRTWFDARALDAALEQICGVRS